MTADVSSSKSGHRHGHTGRAISDDFRRVIEQAGLSPPETIIADGTLHRFSTNGRHDDTAGWYVLHIDGIPAGAFGCWRSGVNDTWCARAEQTLTEAERADHRRRVEALCRHREEEAQRQQIEAAKRAGLLWNAAPPARAEHPYLGNKCIHPHGLKEQEGRLIIPMRDTAGALHSLQFIDADGEKRFFPGGQVVGGFYLIGHITDTLCVTEGFATGASVHEATGVPVAVAFSAGNLVPVAQALRAQYPAATIIICGDHDETGVGQAKGGEAAEAVKGVVAIPEERGTDWNDVHVQQGLETVRHHLATVLYPGAALLHDMSQFIRRFVVLHDAQLRIVALWVVHTYALDAATVTPFLAISSPEKGCGKTRLLEVLALLVKTPWHTVFPSEAVLYRKIDHHHPTLLLDETDAIFGPKAKEYEAIRSLLNSGNRRGTTVTRCVGPKNELRDFEVFAPRALAGIGDLPDTIRDRSIPIRLERRTRAESIEGFAARQRRQAEARAALLRDRLVQWTASVSALLIDAAPNIPESLSDRAQDSAEPLLAIADLAGGDWAALARDALVRLYQTNTGEDPSLGVRLLADLREAFAETEKRSSRDLCNYLTDIETAPWSEFSAGKPMTPRQLADLLRGFGIRPSTIRLADGTTPKGYSRAQFHEAWARYLTSTRQETEFSSAITPQSAPAAANPHFGNPPHSPHVADVGNRETPHPERVVADVVDCDGKTEDEEERLFDVS